MPPTAPIVLLGSNGPAGRYFIEHLKKAGLTADVISRRSLDVPKGFTHLHIDLNQENGWQAPTHATIISFLPLWILADFLPLLAKAKTLIATSSTSRFTKTTSEDESERSTATKLARAENKICSWAEENHISWTILRPTLIYDCKSDANITRMARFIHRWHFLPLAAPALGLRQPIHFDDVAQAAFKCLDNARAANKFFNISGGEILSYRAMAVRIFLALHKKPYFLMLPTGLLQKIFRSFAALGLLKESSFGSSFFQRMNEDLVFDVSEGIDILDYKPRPFNPEFHFGDRGND